MSERTFRLRFVTTADASGIQQTERELADLQAGIKRLDAEYDQLNKSLASGGIESAAGRLNLLAGQSDVAAAGMTRAGRSGGNAGMAVLELSRALEDAQYGIRGVLNNIPGLIAMLGGGAGLAGVVSIAAVALTQLWEKFGGAEEAAQDLEAATKAAEALQARLDSLSKAMTDNFGKALDEQGEKLKSFLKEWEESTKNLSESYKALDEGVQRQLDNDLAKMEVEKEAALAGAQTPEEAKAIEEDFKRRAEARQMQARQESAGLKVDSARQAEEQAAAGMRNAEAARQQALGQMRGADETEADARKRIFGAGIDSDQQRAVNEFERAKQDFGVAAGKGDEEAQQAALQRMQQTGPAAETARQEQAAGISTYEQAKADETMTARQRKVLSDEESRIEMARQEREAAAKRMQEAEAEKARAGEALGDAKRNTGAALDEMGTTEMQAQAQQMRQQRETAPEVTQAAGDASQAMQEGSQSMAQDLRGLGQAFQQFSGEVRGAIGDLAQGQQRALEEARQARSDARAALDAARGATSQGRSYNRED